MAKTILPTADPESPYYPQDAALFSILLTRREEVMPWIHNNYKQIYCHREMYTNYTADFLKVDIWNNCPWIVRHNVPHALIRSHWKRFSDFITDSLDQGLYAFCRYDRFYLSALNDPRHFPHDMFLYGYDGDTLYFRDFQFHYERLNCTREELDTGHLEGLDAGDYLQGVDLLEFRDAAFAFEMDKYARDLGNYVRGESGITSADLYPGLPQYRTDYVYGVEVYPALARYIRDTAANGTPAVIRTAFHLIYYHKRLLENSVAYLAEQGRLMHGKEHEARCRTWTLEMDKLRMILLKFNATGDSSVLERMDAAGRLERAYETEKRDIPRLIADLR